MVGAITAKFYMGTECCKEVGRRYNGKIVQGHKVLEGWGAITHGKTSLTTLVKAEKSSNLVEGQLCVPHTRPLKISIQRGTLRDDILPD